MNEIMVAIITGVFGLVGSVIVAVITANSTKEAVTQKLTVAQAVTDTKIEELTREVRKHTVLRNAYLCSRRKYLLRITE